MAIKEKIYEARGLTLAKQVVASRYTKAVHEENALIGVNYIIDHRTGKVVSPMCTGEAPAWRWAALMIKCGAEFLDETMVEMLP